MKSTRKATGVYAVEVHCFMFTLEKLTGDKYWTLYNFNGTEINRCETKSGMLQLMETWSQAKAFENAQLTFCNYA